MPRPMRAPERWRAAAIAWPTALALASGGCAVPSGAGLSPAVHGRWSGAPPLHHARAAHAVVGTGDALIALGGTGANGPVLEVERFDGHAWHDVARLPGRGLNAPAAAVVGRRLYLIGGFDMATNVPSDQVLVYDLDRGTWSAGPPLPAPRGGHAAAVLDGRIHVIGGGNSVSTIADHDELDPVNGRWTRRAPLPRSEGSPAAVVHAGRLHAIGGRSGPRDFGDVYVWDPATDRWSAGPSIEPRGTAGAVEACGAILLFGGESQAERRSLASVLRLDPGSARWTAVEPMPTARNFARAVPLGDAIYVVGGDPQAGNSHAGAGSAVVERYEPRCAR